MTRAKTPVTTSAVLTQREVSDRFDVPVNTLKTWRHHNKGPRSFLRGGRVVYAEPEVAEWFAAEEHATSRGSRS